MTSLEQSQFLRDARRLLFVIKREHARGWSLRDPVAAFIHGSRNEDFPRSISSILATVDALPLDWREYCAAATAAVFLGADERKRLGVYFTPPILVSHILKRLIEFGYDPKNQTVIDPAAGGAAFLAPVLGAVLDARGAGTDPREAVALIRGIEIERRLAEVTRSILASRIAVAYGRAKPSADDESMARELVTVTDSLEAPEAGLMDVVMGNPPYIRIGAADYIRFQQIWPDAGGDGGYINLAMVFVLKSLGFVREGGLLAFVLPGGFVGGPSFSSFRRAIAPMVLAIDRIEPRERVFADAIQDCVVLILRKGGRGETVPSSLSIDIDRPVKEFGLPSIPTNGLPWAIPTKAKVTHGTHSLRSLGWTGRVGPVVPFRWQSQMFHAADQPERVTSSAKLIWASAIGQDGSFDPTRTSGVAKPDRASVDLKASFVIRSPCVVVQRTSASNQKRRICAAAIDISMVRRYGPMVGDNHVIALFPPDTVKNADQAVNSMAARLNSLEMSTVYASSCGTASVSVKQLMEMYLPE
ncbi:N-6 DNA methylase [Mesorhizobium sp. M0138]|uniref:N-6 DNA methylase n=1 Tax=Mesorhizobium sp. M0138 TaxID=2956891 RepID=UPI0033356BEF